MLKRTLDLIRSIYSHVLTECRSICATTCALREKCPYSKLFWFAHTFHAVRSFAYSVCYMNIVTRSNLVFWDVLVSTLPRCYDKCNFFIVLNVVWRRNGRIQVPDNLQDYIDGFKRNIRNYFIGLQNLYLLLAGNSVNLRVAALSDAWREVVYHNVSISDNDTYKINLSGHTKGGNLSKVI